MSESKPTDGSWIIVLPDTSGVYYFVAPGFVSGRAAAAVYRYREHCDAEQAMRDAIAESHAWKMSGQPYWMRIPAWQPHTSPAGVKHYRRE